eukprot:6960490-Pyramimonas_sp.AAC.1
MARSIGLESFPYIEKEFDELPRSTPFDMPLLSRETPVRPTVQPHYTILGPVTEGPAKPGTSGNVVPVDADLTGTIDNVTFINYHPFTKDGPAKPLTAQPSVGNRGHAPAATPPGGAGQDKDGD